MKGVFITFEGTEGTGKTTQVRLLAEELRDRGHRVLVTREPGGTTFGRTLRGLLLDPAGATIAPWAELFLYLADRAQHTREVITPALERGEIVLCDRFQDATIAYQGYGRGLDATFIAEAGARAASGLIPDLTFLLHFDEVDEGLARARRRQGRDGTAGREDRFEREDLAFHVRVRDGYRALASAEPLRFRVLPARGAIEELRALVLQEVMSFIARGVGEGGR